TSWLPRLLVGESKRDGRVGLDRNAQRIRQTVQLKNCACPGLPIFHLPSISGFQTYHRFSFQCFRFYSLLPVRQKTKSPWRRAWHGRSAQRLSNSTISAMSTSVTNKIISRHCPGVSRPALASFLAGTTPALSCASFIASS